MDLNKLFKPKFKFYELEYFLGRNKEISISNTSIYQFLEKFTKTVSPFSKDKYEKKWEDFYLPLKRSGKLISVPFNILKYKRKFYVTFQTSERNCLIIGKGREKIEKFYKNIFFEVFKFLKIIKKTKGKIIEKTVPYDIRTGKIKGKYIMEKVMPLKEKERIITDYRNHLKKGLKISSISLNDYLYIASICYKAAYGKKILNLSLEKMYKKWADGRDGGMLSIKNKKSKKEFMTWLKSGEWIIAHPFEIVFSWLRHGIHLYPPRKEKPHFSLRVTNYGYVEDFIKMIRALIKENIPFEALDLEKVLKYLIGESYFTVNDYNENFFFYVPSKESKKRYFKYIEWDRLKVVNFI